MRVGAAGFRPTREIADHEAIEIVRECIRAAFPGPSIEAVADRAAGPLLTTPRTIRRIFDGTTRRFDGGVGFRALAFAIGKIDSGRLATLQARVFNAINQTGDER